MPSPQGSGNGEGQTMAIASAGANGGAGDAGGTAPSSSVMSKVDKTGLYDLQQVKRVLDDLVIDYLEKRGYAEATLVSNAKIFTGIVAVVAAFYAHFNGREFPENRGLVMACVATYSVCVSLVSAVSYVYEGDAFFCAYLSDDAERMTGKHEDEDAVARKVWVQSTLSEKGNSVYTLTIRRCVRKSKELSAVLAKPYEEYYCEDGQVAVDELHEDLAGLIAKAGRLGAGGDKSK